MKNNNLLVLPILIVVLFNSIVYSALNSEMFITGDAHIRVNKDIRIANIKVLEHTNGAYETYNSDYSKNTTSLQVTLPSSESVMIYEVTISNKSSIDYEVSNIVEEVYSNNNIKYELIDLQENDVIKASSILTFKIKLTQINNELNQVNLILKYNFQESIAIGTTYSFSYTGKDQEFIVPCNGVYKVELWGGGNGNTNSTRLGYGGYTSGNIELKYNDTLYIYVGQNGYVNSIVFNANNTQVGANGGGGATDIRLINGNWDSFVSLKSRIMVAAGAGGAGWRADGGAGGGLIGYTTTGYHNSNGKNYMGKGATQISSGLGGNNNTSFNGDFGIGGNRSLGSFGGGGYYGGGGGYGIVNIDHGSGGGGSSFISGHNGCDAIKEESTSDNIVHTGQNVHYSGYKFTDTVMIDGKGYNWTNIKGNYTGMPSHDGKNTISGNSGNGYAKITLVKKLIYKQNSMRLS